MVIYLETADIARSGQRVLDVGTKDGRHYVENDAEAVGVDIDPKTPQRDIQLIQADGGQLPFPDDTFDIVVSNQVYEHLPQELRVAVTRDVARVLSPDGVYIMSFSNRLFPFGNHGIGVPGFQYLSYSVRHWLADRFLSEEDQEYHRDQLFYVSPITVRPTLEDHFDDVEYFTTTLGRKHGEEVWPTFVNQMWPFIVSTAAGRWLVEMFFGYAAYVCWGPMSGENGVS
jgi:SAM-dependent methyltransferase